MRLALIQSDTNWEKPDENTAAIEALFETIKESPDLVLLPEMFSTGFTMNVSLAEAMDGKTVQWLRKQARKLNCCVGGSLIIKDNNRYFNRFVLAFEDGKIIFYDKRHLFRMAGENHYFEKGSRKRIFEYRGWRICPQICYDLRFPVWFRNRDEYDLLINVGNWPAVRQEVWITLLKARAIENMVFAAGVNRTGIDPSGNRYAGDTMVAAPDGRIIASASDKKGVLETVLHLSGLQELRQSFPVHLDADDFKMNGY